jgi:hypothetical protein
VEAYCAKSLFVPAHGAMSEVRQRAPPEGGTPAPDVAPAASTPADSAESDHVRTRRPFVCVRERQIAIPVIDRRPPSFYSDWSIHQWSNHHDRIEDVTKPPFNTHLDRSN